jgi:hypothetical protein
MPYWENVSRSFRIAWNHKYLWLIALFAGEGGGASFNFNQGTSAPGGGGAGRQPDVSVIQQQVTTWIGDHVALLVAIALIWIVLVVVFFILGAVCEGATVRATAEHDAERPFGLGWAWRIGVSTMWVIVRFRLVLLLIGLPLFLLYLAFAASVVIAVVNRNGGAVGPLIGFGGLLVLITIPYALYFFFLDKLGSRAVILEQIGARAGIVRAHRLLFKRLGRALLVWLLAVAVGLALGVGLACVLALVLVPLVLVGAAIAYANNSAIVPLILVGILILLPISLAIQGFLAAQSATYWTLAFRRLDIDYPPAPAPSYPPLQAPPPPATPAS